MRKLFFIAVLAASMLSIDLAAFDIVKEGKPAAVIVLGRRTKLTLLALEVLQTSVEKCTGAKLQMIRPKDLSKVPADLNRIFIGDCNYAAGKNLKSSDLKMEEYLIKADGKDLFLLANDKAAPHWKTTGAPGLRDPEMDFRQYSPAHLWAVVELLDRHAGVRFLWPGEKGAYYPKQKNISVKDGYFFKSRPFFVRRHIWFGAGTYSKILPETNKYMLIHQQGSRIQSLFVDGFSSYWDRFKDSKPEIFALSPEGKRTYFVKPVYLKLCLSNPEVAEIILDDWRKAGRPDNWSMCPNDGHGFCTCKNCRAMDSAEAQKGTPEQVWRARVSLTRRYAIFWNRIIKAMRAENPNTRIYVFGYGPYKVFPEDIKLEPGIVSAVVPGDYDIRGKGMVEWQSWGNSGAELFIRPNWLCTFPFTNYYPYHKVIEFMNHARKSGCVGYEHDSTAGCWAAQGIYYYILARNSYRPDLSIDEIKNEFASAFGKGAPDILRWMQYWEDYTALLRGGIAEEDTTGTGGLYEAICKKDRRIRSHILYGCWDALVECYPPEVMAKAYKMLDDAEKKIGKDDPEALERVQFLRDGMDHIVLMQKCLTLFWKEPLGRSDEFMKAFQALRDFRFEKEKSFVVNLHALMYKEFARRIRIVPRNPDGSIQVESHYESYWMPQNRH